MKTEMLYFKEGSSDKQYQISLGDDGTVLASWGRRGGPQQSQSFGPLPLPEAEKLYNKKLKEKLAKGYQPGEAGTAMVAGNGTTAPDGVQRPMLLNEIEQDRIDPFINDPLWWMQEKYDGFRCLLERDGQKVAGWSRTGKSFALPQSVVAAALAIKADRYMIDGELVGDSLWAFDVLRCDKIVGDQITTWAYADRLSSLHGMLLENGYSHEGIKIVPTAMKTKDKACLLAEVTSHGGEGVVLKDCSSPYSPGRPNSGGPALKFKFVKTASVIVEKINTIRSVAVRLHDGTPLGNVAIPANKDFPVPGDVVEIRYLTINRGGSLIQPFYLGLRPDIPAEECTEDQLKYKNE